MEFAIATHNKHKLAEIKRILESQGHIGFGLDDLHITIDLPETGETFAENAAFKANSVCTAAGMPAIGDDSGLEVDALSGAPGVYSARFAGEHATDDENNQKLLELLALTPYAARTGQYVCVIALSMPDGSGMEVEGRCSGLVGFEPAGTNGFGYDPYFYVNGRSIASMTDEEKDAISHRGAALRRFMEELPHFLGGAK